MSLGLDLCFGAADRLPIDRMAAEEVIISSLSHYLGRDVVNSEDLEWGDRDTPVWTVHVWCDRDTASWMDDGTEGHMDQSDASRQELTIRVRPGLGKGDTVQILAHETAHVAQVIEGSITDLLAVSLQADAWAARPVEVDAITRTAEWVGIANPAALYVTPRVWANAVARAAWETEEVSFQEWKAGRGLGPAA